MTYLEIVLGLAVVLAILWDAFTTIVMPKAVERRFNVAAIYYNAIWNVWQFLAKRLGDRPLRLTILGAFAPISLLFLFVLWALCLVVGFAFVNCGSSTLGDGVGLGEHLYYSGVTFFTLGFGDLTPKGTWGHILSVIEAGTGFAFLAIVIGYIPVLYTHFSTREHQIMLLDSKAGSDPTATELLRRHGAAGAMEDLIMLLKEWEAWSAHQLEAYLSYSSLAYYRSQHDHQSWLCALTSILDACALISIGFEGEHEWDKRLRFQAQATFAMGRHVIVDLAYILNVPPSDNAPSRMTPGDWTRLHDLLREAGIPLRQDCGPAFKEFCALYEPYCVSLARDLFFQLPAWVPEQAKLDNWQVTAWDRPHHF